MKWSEKLELDFPYDWMSNVMSEDVLIASVLRRGRFDDISKVCAHFGLARLENTAFDFDIDLKSIVLAPLMNSIRKAEASFRDQHETCT